eukprot:TRINITY_DN6966_c0_g1_i3.p1 TRINITY_DN6966_c0_g1~~TRINITY_DN6966_c0_g1_i3.p1  ORF type:complete len:450 (-),score=83.28 TRINITY_DN6966_c0_g1_i3:106-1455(-)
MSDKSNTNDGDAQVGPKSQQPQEKITELLNSSQIGTHVGFSTGSQSNCSTTQSSPLSRFPTIQAGHQLQAGMKQVLSTNPGKMTQSLQHPRPQMGVTSFQAPLPNSSSGNTRILRELENEKQSGGRTTRSLRVPELITCPRSPTVLLSSRVVGNPPQMTRLDPLWEMEDFAENQDHGDSLDLEKQFKRQCQRTEQAKLLLEKELEKQREYKRQIDLSTRPFTKPTSLQPSGDYVGRPSYFSLFGNYKHSEREGDDDTFPGLGLERESFPRHIYSPSYGYPSTLSYHSQSTPDVSPDFGGISPRTLPNIGQQLSPKLSPPKEFFENEFKKETLPSASVTSLPSCTMIRDLSLFPTAPYTPTQLNHPNFQEISKIWDQDPVKSHTSASANGHNLFRGDERGRTSYLGLERGHNCALATQLPSTRLLVPPNLTPQYGGSKPIPWPLLSSNSD